MDSKCLGTVSKSLPAIVKILAVSTVRRSFIDTGVLRKLLQFFKNNRSNLSQASKVIRQFCYHHSNKLGTGSLVRDFASVLALILADDNPITAGNAAYTNYVFLNGVHKEEASSLGLNALVKPTVRLLKGDHFKLALDSLKILIPLDASHVDLFLEGGGIDAFGHLLSSSPKMDFGPICEITKIALSRDKMVIQSMIDCQLLSRLIDNIRSSKYRLVLGTLEIVALVLNVSAGSQAKYLASLNCIGPIVNHASSDDAKMAALALETLKDFVRASMTAANGAKRGCHSSLYEKIGELLDENKNLGREREYLDLLKKKQAWNIANRQGEYAQSLQDALEHLIRQKAFAHAGHEQLEKQLSEKKPLRVVCKSITEEHAKIKALLDGQISKLDKDLAAAQAKQNDLNEYAERIAPKNQWQERLDDPSLPKSYSDYSKAIHKCEQTILSIKISRRNKEDLGELQSSIEGLFKDEDNVAEDAEDPAHVEDRKNTSPKKRKLPSRESREKRNARVSMGSTQEDVDESEEEEDEQLEVAKKSRTQRSIASFFGKSL